VKHPYFLKTEQKASPMHKLLLPLALITFGTNLSAAPIVVPSTTTTFDNGNSDEKFTETLNWDSGLPTGTEVGLFNFTTASVALDGSPTNYTIVQSAGTITANSNRTFEGTTWYFQGGILDMGGSNILHSNSASMDLYMVGGTVQNVGTFRPRNSGSLTLESGSFSTSSLATDNTSTINFIDNATASFTVAGYTQSDYEILWTDTVLKYNGGNTGTFSDHFQVTGSTLTAIPEPSTFALMGIVLGAFGLSRMRNRRK
jgi:hypothetical protein